MRPITMLAAQKKMSEKTGELLSWTNNLGGYLSYQEPYNLKIFGRSVQDGTPAPEAPITIQSVSGNLRAAGVDQPGGTTLAITGRGIPLGSTIPAAIQSSPALMAGVWHDGTQYWCSDTDEPDVHIGGARYRRQVQRVARQNPVVRQNNSIAEYAGNRSAYLIKPDDCINRGNQIPLIGMCNKFINAGTHIGGYASALNVGHIYTSGNASLFAAFEKTATDEYIGAVLANTYIDYLLAEPVVTLSDPVPIPSVRGTTNIYTASAVQPHLKAAVLIPRGATT